MADFSFSDDLELKQLSAKVVEEPEKYENWESLVQAAQQQEGGIGRNSSPQAIAATREVYDRFLAQFPLFFGYWKKYADLEFAIAGTEAAEMVYERGIASIGSSVDLWTAYCNFKTETNHDTEVITQLFERGADSVGLDFRADPFWDKYIEFEERMDRPDLIFKILSRIVTIPLHQYTRYFERYRALAAKEPVEALAPEDVLSRFKQEIVDEHNMDPVQPEEMDHELRTKLATYHNEIGKKTHEELVKRWTYESAISRPYYHVTELDDAQLENWRKYLDFEEAENDYVRTKFLYERCLVAAANYEEFWLRYAKWMVAQDKLDDVRTIYQLASYIYVPIAQPEVRLMWAMFEEATGRVDTAADILEAILTNLPTHKETIMALANLRTRQYGVNAGVEVLQKFVNDTERPVTLRGALVSEWARKVWNKKGDAPGARKIWQAHQTQFSDCVPFWMEWLLFELRLPSFGPKAPGSYDNVKAVYTTIREKSNLTAEAISEATTLYRGYLAEHGGPDAMKEAFEIDSGVKNPFGGKSSDLVANGAGAAQRE